jgi:hypothetical protein
MQLDTRIESLDHEGFRDKLRRPHRRRRAPGKAERNEQNYQKSNLHSTPLS